jgi:zinc transport system substrate-binding protein
LIVGHEAYGYLVQSYGFEQVGVSGVSPESEPSPARLAEVARLVKEIGATSIYSESALDRKVADTIAAETGAKVLVLSPLESLASESEDYFSVMRANLEALRIGQGCS